MKYLAPIPKQFVDQSGIPLSDGTVHVYISGDSQYANVYQDADGDELMPNPARLDSNGAWLGFVTSGVPLDYVVKDNNGNIQFEYEKVIAGDGVQPSDIEPLTFVCPKYDGITGIFEYLVTAAKTIFSRFLVFKYRNEVIGSYQPLDDASSLAEEIVIPEESFILRHSSMSVPLTDEEFNTCSSKFLAGIAVSIQYASGGISKCDLTQITTGGSLEFSYCQNGSIVTFTISPNSPHAIFPAVKTIPNPNAVLNVTLGGQTKTYTPTGANLSLDIDNEVSRIYLAKGSADVSTLNAGISGIQNGWSYVLTDSGTLTLGNVSVQADDNVAWDGSKWFKVGNQVNINALFIVQDEEYLYALTDSNGTLLFGVRIDGSVTWQKGIPELLQSILDNKVDKINGKSIIDTNFCDSATTANDTEFVFAIVDSLDGIIVGLRYDGTIYTSLVPDNVQRRVPGKDVTNEQFAASQHSTKDGEFSFAITDTDDSVLLGIRRDGTFVCDGLVKLITGDSGEIASKAYVDDAVDSEKTRAENAESELSERISNINPVIVEGGENTPDEVFLTTDVNDAVTFKNITRTTLGYNVIYVKPNDDIVSVLETSQNSIIKVFFPFNLLGEEASIADNAVIDFCGGCIYNGRLIGNFTKVNFTKGCIGSDLEIAGTWDVSYIRSDVLTNPQAVNSLKNLCGFLSDSLFNTLHIVPGNYTFTPQSNADKLIELKSNTKLIVDGTLAITPNGFPNYYLVRAVNSSNLEITGKGKIIGDADEHDYTTTPSTHEWGMCIMLAGCEKVFVHDIILEDATGDGVDIAESSSRVPKQICVEHCTINHCGRQGISVTSGEQIKISDCKINDIYRTLPMAAVDIEANLSHRVYNVDVSNLKISNCRGVMAIHTDCVEFKRIEAENCGTLFYAEDANFVKLADVVSDGSVASSDFVIAQNDCSHIDFDNVTTSNSENFVIRLPNIRINHLCDFGTAQIIGNPVESSTRYSNGKFIQFNGIDWVNFDGTPLT